MLHPPVPRVKPSELSVLDELTIPCTVREYPTPVMIENKVHIRVANPVKYRTSESPELRSWLRETLGRLIPEILFEAHYTDLLLRFGECKEKIEHAVDAAADGIGCEISQFITVPNIPSWLFHPFVATTGGAFPTRLHNVEAKLEVSVTAHIPNPEDIAPLLSSQPDIPRAMEKAINAAIGEWMHAIDPERFYMRFSFTDSEHHPEETQSVETELVELIENRLTNGEFHAEVIRTIIKIGETDLTRRFRELQEAIDSFAVLVQSLDFVTVEFVGNLRLVAVHWDGWSRFRGLTGGSGQITAKIRDLVDTVLHPLPADELLYREEAGRRELAMKVSTAVHQYAIAEFGLVVQVSNFRRRRSE